MANAQLTEEELQQSVVLSEEDAEYEEDDGVEDSTMIDNGASQTLGTSSRPAGQAEELDELEDDQEEDEDVDMMDHPESSPRKSHLDESEPDLTNDEDADNEDGESSSEDGDLHDDDEPFDIDADGEEEQEGNTYQPERRANLEADLSGEDEEHVEAGEEEGEGEEEEAEGVGAVKIKPGETDDEDSDIEPSGSSASAFSDGDSVAEWDDAVENEEEDEDDNRDEESDADRRICIFCKNVARRNMAKVANTDLVCKGCGEHAHQQCARNENAIHDRTATSKWKCPECIDDNTESDIDTDGGAATDNVDTEGDIVMKVEDEYARDISPASTRRASAPQIARDLLPPQRGATKPDSHSVFNQLVLDEDPMDGSRVLRKRKTSSVEAEEDGIARRTRRKTTSDRSMQDDSTHELGDAEEPSARPRAVRSLRRKASNAELPCTVVKKTRGSCILKMRVNADELNQIVSRRPRFPRKRPGARKVTTSRTVASRSNTTVANAVEPSTPPPVFAPSFSQPFYSFYDKETDELKGKPYGGILTEEQADTSKTLPTKDDRRRFDEAKQKAEEEWRNRLLAMQAESDLPSKKSKKTSGPVSQIECIEFGGWEIETWYAAPYPEEYSRNRVLYICEFCLKYMNSDYVAWRHKLKCPAKHPPGDEIYRHGSISFFEVDGRKNPVYCQNLCLLAKLFLGSKTLYYDVEPFLFYVLCEYDDLGYHFVGYFSKEKRASSQNNVSCILTLPIHQRKGYGHLLIDFSYLLTRVEEKSGSPEKPLSDMGLVSYRNYWRLILCKYLIEHVPADTGQIRGVSIKKISDDTGMTPDDVISALEALRFLVRDPVTHVYAFRVDLPYCQKEVAKWEAKNHVKLNPRALTWTPYVMGRGNAANFELGPALNAIAPREDHEESKPVEVITDIDVATEDFTTVSSLAAKRPSEDVPAVLESTEPHDNISTDALTDIKINGSGKKSDSVCPSDQGGGQPSAECATATLDDKDGWQGQYEKIPVTRFQVFPPISKRMGMGRGGSRLGMGRPVGLPNASSAIRTPAPTRRPRGRRPGGASSTRKTAQKKANTAKRKSGGTGRGPGRWPKGTKKSDYGNADSGPGLPPAWLEKQKLSLGSIAAADPDDENKMHDTVQVQVEESKGKKDKGKQVESISARFEIKSDLEQEGMPGSNGDKTDGLTGAGDSQDITMGQAEEYEDVDAPGEEE